MASSSASWMVVLRRSLVVSSESLDSARDAWLLAIAASNFSFCSRVCAASISDWCLAFCLSFVICCCSVSSSRWSFSLAISARASASSALSFSALRELFLVRVSSSGLLLFFLFSEFFWSVAAVWANAENDVAAMAAGIMINFFIGEYYDLMMFYSNHKIWCWGHGLMRLVALTNVCIVACNF